MRFVCLIAAIPLLPCAVLSQTPAASPAAVPAVSADASNNLALVQAYLQLQEQLQAALAAIEQNRQETKRAAAATAQSFSNALHIVQSNFAAQRARDLEVIQESNTLILRLAGALAAAGFLAMLIMGFLQWRLNRGLAQLSAALPSRLALRNPPPPTALGPAKAHEPLAIRGTAQRESLLHEPDPSPHAAPKPHRRLGRSIELWLFPNPGDSLRRRQFRSLKTAVLFGLLCGGLVALVFYLVSTRPGI